MSKSAKRVVIIIGAVSLVTGVVRFIQGDKMDALLAILMGACLVGTIYFDKPKAE